MASAASLADAEAYTAAIEADRETDSEADWEAESESKEEIPLDDCPLPDGCVLVIVTSGTLSTLWEGLALVGLADDLLLFSLTDACPFILGSPVGLAVLELVAGDGDETSLAPPVAASVNAVLIPSRYSLVQTPCGWPKLW